MTKRNIIINSILSIIVSIGFVGVFSATPVFAAQCAGQPTSIIDCGGKKGKDAIFEVIRTIIKIMTAGVGILAVGAVAVGGVLYASSEGSPDKIQRARQIWLNTAIGILMFGFLFGLTNFIIPGGVFQ